MQMNLVTLRHCITWVWHLQLV